jgi:hypothetical protein
VGEFGITSVHLDPLQPFALEQPCMLTFADLDQPYLAGPISFRESAARHARNQVFLQQIVCQVRTPHSNRAVRFKTS